MARTRNAIRHEAEPAFLGGDHAIIAPHPCMRWGPVGSRTMMQLYASVAKLRSSGSPFSGPAWKPWGRREPPLPRIVHGGSALKSAGTPKLVALFLLLSVLMVRCLGRRLQLEAFRHHPCVDITPERDDQFSRERHNHRFARSPSVLGAAFKPKHKIALGVELHDPPR
jgi:hypothetical protein